MPSTPPSALPMAIPMAATRTVATACVALPSQAATGRENNTSHQTLSAEGAPATTDASDTGSMKAN